MSIPLLGTTFRGRPLDRRRNLPSGRAVLGKPSSIIEKEVWAFLPGNMAHVTWSSRGFITLSFDLEMPDGHVSRLWRFADFQGGKENWPRIGTRQSLCVGFWLIEICDESRTL